MIHASVSSHDFTTSTNPSDDNIFKRAKNEGMVENHIKIIWLLNLDSLLSLNNNKNN